MKEKIEIFQINIDRDINREAFMSYSARSSINEVIYDKVFDDEIELSETGDKHALEEIYRIFNINHPKNYKGRSLSVSDVIKYHNHYYYCDSIGYEKLSCFRENLCTDLTGLTLSVLVCMPGKDIVSTKIKEKELYQILGTTNLQEIHYDDENVRFVKTNIKLSEDQMCRAIYIDNNLYDIIYGPFIIVGYDQKKKQLRSLTPSEVVTYSTRYRYAEELIQYKNRPVIESKSKTVIVHDKTYNGGVVY